MSPRRASRGHTAGIVLEAGIALAASLVSAPLSQAVESLYLSGDKVT